MSVVNIDYLDFELSVVNTDYLDFELSVVNINIDYLDFVNTSTFGSCERRHVYRPSPCQSKRRRESGTCGTALCTREGKQPFFCNVVVRWVIVHNARPVFVVTDQIVHNRLHKYNPERAGFCTHFRTSTFECLHKTVLCIEMTYRFFL